MSLPHSDSSIWTTAPDIAFRNFVISGEFVKLGRRPPTVDRNTPNDEPNTVLRIRDSAANVYTSMFNKYLRWLKKNNLCITHVKPIHIKAFIEANHSEPGQEPQYLQSSIKLRYLRMLERTYQHMKLDPNPAREVLIEARNHPTIHGKDESSEVLTEEEITAFIQNMPPPSNWKRSRDRAMQAILIGAGLKPSEVIGLYVENVGNSGDIESIKPNESIRITISAASVDGVSRWHQSKLNPIVQQDLLQWMKWRLSLSFESDLLFPANFQGKKLDKATLYRSVKKTFSEANIDVLRLGGRTLRNTFAVSALKSGTSPETVKEYLGLNEDKSMNMYLALSGGSNE